MTATPIPARGAFNYAGLMPPAIQRRAKDFFVYSTRQQLVPIAAGATLQAETEIQADSAFLAVAGVATVRTDAAPPVVQTDQAIFVTVSDSGSGRRVMDDEVDFVALFGTAQLPAYWPYPKLFKPSATIQTQVRNATGADRQVRIYYWGFKLFEWQDIARDFYGIT